MERVTDWIQLWRELVQARVAAQETAQPESKRDHWKDKSKYFDASVRRRWASPDSSRDFVVARLDAAPGSTLLDIGAGTGNWAILLSPHVHKITAIDSSAAMIQVMQENLHAENIANVRVIQGEWPDVQIEPHDFALCSHAMYAYADLPAFVQQMERTTRRTIFLLMRAPTIDGIMAEAATRIWGHPYDSPNFQVAYNALLQMGILPNVLMENTGLWRPWTSASLADALSEMKQRFGLEQISEHDDFLKDLLRRRLTPVDGKYEWTTSVRSALVYWDTDRYSSNHKQNNGEKIK